MAFVLIPHLNPSHESMMVNLLSKCTTMPVIEAEQGMVVEVDRLYIIPPNYFLAIRDGKLQLSDSPSDLGGQTSIDFFLRSLADDQGQRAIGIVLSGTGSPGSLGIRPTKTSCGMGRSQLADTVEHGQKAAKTQKKRGSNRATFFLAGFRYLSYLCRIWTSS